MSDKPAFPCVPGTGTQDGMTLRQWYAGMAMSGLMSQAKLHLADENPLQRYAAWAFMAADAMIAEMEKE